MGVKNKMKLKFLGTAGCSGIPSMYCQCPVCENARKVMGKEFRTRTGFVLDEKVAIDFSPDSYQNMTRNGINFGSIKHLLITHSHEDHYYPQDLVLRVTATRAPYPDIEKKLNLYGNSTVLRLFKEVVFFKEKVLETVNLIEIEKNQTFNMDDYKVTTFYAPHMLTEDSLVFLIERNNQAYLHLVDTGFPTDELFDYLKNNNIKLDAVTADCTYGTGEVEYGGHMQIWQNIRVKNRLIELGVLKENTPYYLTHFSEWNGIDTHESLCEVAKKYGLTVAYDGMTVEF